MGEGKESLKVGVPDPDPLTLSRQKKVQRAWAGGTDGTGRGEGTADKALDQFLPQD